MELITFSTLEKKEFLGLVVEKNLVIDLTTTFGKKYPYFSNMLDFIRAGDKAFHVIEQIYPSSIDEAETENLEEVTIHAPITKPIRNIYCVGLNYAEHTVEFSGGKTETIDYPIIFSKASTSVIGPEEDISLHKTITEEVDYEAELGVIIGKGGSDIPKDKVFDHVFGYTIINDVTARDLQRKHKQWLLGKSLDTFCPIGPHIVPKSEIPDPDNLKISCVINGEVRQSSNTKHMIFDIPEIISTISKGHSLQPGDIVATGTCEGVGMGFDPPRFLQNGDVVEVEIEKIGVLRNTVKE